MREVPEEAYGGDEALKEGNRRISCPSPEEQRSERHRWQIRQLIQQIVFLLLSTLLVRASAQEFEGDNCTLDTNESGICTLIPNCPSARASLLMGNPPQLCSFKQDVPIVCCKREDIRPTNLGGSSQHHHPTQSAGVSSTPRPIHSGGGASQTKRRISEIKCEEYSELVTEVVHALSLTLDAKPISHKYPICSITGEQLIVGGEKTVAGEFPHMAAIGYQNINSQGYQWNCGGTLISESYILTAAHCVTSKSKPPVVVRLGELNLDTDDADKASFHIPGCLGCKENASSGDYKISRIIRHPNYQAPAKYHDIALLKLEQPVKPFTLLVRPACLYRQDTISKNKAIATGWGLVGFGEGQSDVLLKVSLSFIDSIKCNELYRIDQTTGSLPQGIQSSMICAGELKGGKDACKGDSGGPLQIQSENNKCVYNIIGVTSFGKPCGFANSPGVFTRVSTYISWIESIVWPSS